MTLRSKSIIAGIVVVALTTCNRASAQPVVPQSPHSSAFGSLFYPGSSVTPNAGMSLYGINRLGVNGGFGNGQGGGFGSQGYYGPFAPFVLNMQPVVFNNRGHWYANYYGHWYPNGLTNGVGVLSNGGTGAGSRLGTGVGLVNAGGSIGAGGFGLPGGAGGMPGAMPGGMPGAAPGAMPGLGGPGINR